MPRLAWHLEEPRVGQSYPNFYAAQLASKFVKVVLSGAGGDETVRRLSVALLPRRGQRRLRGLHRQVLRVLAAAASEHRAASGSSRPICGRGRATSGPATSSATCSPHHAPELTRPEDYINHSLYFEAKTFLHGLLVVEDKLSMAHSLETRLPFLDNDLVDFAQRLPVGLKLGNLGEVVRLNENEPGPEDQRFFERDRGREADPASGDGALHSRETSPRRRSRASRAPDASWFRGESIDYVRRR